MGKRKEETRIKSIERGAGWKKRVSFFGHVNKGAQWAAGYEGLKSRKGPTLEI